MDTTPENILMCEKATEIQANHTWEEGDIPHYGDEFPGQVAIYSKHCYACRWELEHRSPNWLPRQDQLQAMVNPEGQGIIGFMYQFYRFMDALYCDWRDPWIAEVFKKQGRISLEQFWLCYVMKEKYQKHWTGEEWVEV